jgi:hypothetical protein
MHNLLIGFFIVAFVFIACVHDETLEKKQAEQEDTANDDTGDTSDTGGLGGNPNPPPDR